MISNYTAKKGHIIITALLVLSLVFSFKVASAETMTVTQSIFSSWLQSLQNALQFLQQLKTTPVTSQITSSQSPEIVCDVSDPKITENLTAQGLYTYGTITQGSHTFKVVAADKNQKKWITIDAWEVCGQPVVFIQNLGFNILEPERFIWNGRIFEVPNNVQPLDDVHHQIAFKTDFFGTGVIDKKEYSFADVSEKAYTVAGKAAVVQVATTASGSKSMSVLYNGVSYGPYVSVASPVVSVDNKPTYFAAEKGREYAVYQSGKQISSAGVTGVPLSDRSLIEFKKQPAYILGSLSGETNVYVGTQKQVNIAGTAYSLVAAGESLGVSTAIRNINSDDFANRDSVPQLYINGKDMGKGSSMYAAAGEIGYLRQGATEEDYDIVRGTERVGTISNPSVFYPVRSTGGFGDLTFIGATPAYVYRGGYTGDKYTYQYVQYGKEKLFVDYEVGYVANIGGKLVIGGSKDRTDFVFIEQ